MLMKDLKDFFYYNKRERNGIIILLFLIVISYSSIYIWQYLFPAKQIDLAVYEEEINSFRAQQKKVTTQKQFESIATDNSIPVKAEKQRFDTENSPIISINLNTNDTSDWKKLRGIGPVYSNRIIKYKNLLGGYVAKEQLLEVYGIKHELYMLIIDQIFIDTNAIIKQMDINRAAYGTLLRHPYISKKMVHDIVNYRKEHLFTTVKEIKNITFITDSLYLKLEPYLTIDD